MRSLLLAAPLIVPALGNAALLGSLGEAAEAAGADCAVELTVGGEAGGVACTTEFATRTAVAVLGWAGAVAFMWASETTTPLPCGSNFELNGQTCFNFPAGSKCYQDCCSVQSDWCHSQGGGVDAVAQCLKDRACVDPNVQAFSSAQLAFLHDDMDDLNTAYNELLAFWDGVDLDTIRQNKQWHDLMMNSNNMLLKAGDFMDAIHSAKEHVYCDNAGVTCDALGASHSYDLNNGATCFNFLGPCYSDCCQAQRDWCHTDDQCVHDRACRTPSEPDPDEDDTLQARICRHLGRCGRDMRDATGFLTNLHDCAATAASNPCSKSDVENQYNQITSKLDATREELQALESTAAGAGRVTLAPLLLPEVPQVQVPDLSHFRDLAADRPFEVFCHPSSHASAPAPEAWTSFATNAWILSTVWTIAMCALFFHFVLRTLLQLEEDQKTRSASGELAQPFFPQNEVKKDKIFLSQVFFGVWLLGQCAIFYLEQPVQKYVQSLMETDAIAPPLAQMASGPAYDANIHYWHSVSRDMNTISEAMTSAQSSCSPMLFNPIFTDLHDLFNTLTTDPTAEV